ncbi:DUF397 domain-containing protein [Kitasatospora putterlickiae]|uniref:DUF397 domain-containing protein n=1 Tax=Kitasatospora putterlickiae TaxID=221725 RepID=A0ABN1XTD7_9ACTN
MDGIDLSAVAWRKSSYSGGNGGDCIEVALASPAPGVVPVRDSKDPSGPVLLFPSASWQSFLASLRDGSLPVG